jgi:hypothetical protein
MNMSPSSVALFLTGTALGVAGTLIGTSVWQPSPNATDNRIVLADGFRNITFDEGKFKLELVSRIDPSTIEITKTLEIPTEGFLRGYSAMEQLVDRLIADGVFKKTGPEPAK